MKAYQVVEYGKPIISQRVPDPVPTAREVVVDVLACGLRQEDSGSEIGKEIAAWLTGRA
jgi:propanol-preferring alcohol dehydrogenase